MRPNAIPRTGRSFGVPALASSSCAGPLAASLPSVTRTSASRRARLVCDNVSARRLRTPDSRWYVGKRIRAVDMFISQPGSLCQPGFSPVQCAVAPRVDEFNVAKLTSLLRSTGSGENPAIQRANTDLSVTGRRCAATSGVRCNRRRGVQGSSEHGDRGAVSRVRGYGRRTQATARRRPRCAWRAPYRSSTSAGRVLHGGCRLTLSRRRYCATTARRAVGFSHQRNGYSSPLRSANRCSQIRC